MRIRTAVATLSAAVATAGATSCGTGIEQLPAGSGAGHSASVTVVLQPGPAIPSAGPPPRLPSWGVPQDGSGRPVPYEPITDAAEALRFVLDDGNRWASLASRGTGAGLDLGRATGAVTLARLRPGTDLVRDGRGTRLVLVDWAVRQPDLRDDRGGPAPEPYRSACPPDRVGPT